MTKLEQAARRYAKKQYRNDFANIFVGVEECSEADFIAGAKWAERRSRKMDFHDKDLSAFCDELPNLTQTRKLLTNKRKKT